VFTVEVEGVTPFLKLATASRNGEDHHTFASDKPVPVTGSTVLNGKLMETPR
jgi:hypothetical protein